MITPALKKAIAVHAAENQLTGFRVSIAEVKATRRAIEEGSPESAIVKRILHRMDALVDRLEMGAGLLQKQIGG